MAANDQYLPGNEPFGMSAGISNTGAAGSQPMTGQADAMSAETTYPLTNQTYTGSAGTAYSAQLTEGFSGQGPSAIASTGAGKGSGHDPHTNAA